jgi:hypothetical protein
LCEAFIEELKEHEPAWLAKLATIDIDDSPEALSRYNALVPVVVVDGKVVCQHFFDAAKLAPYFLE